MSYSTQRAHNKAWPALWHWLLDTTLTNTTIIYRKANKHVFTSSQTSRIHRTVRDAVIEYLTRNQRLLRGQRRNRYTAQPKLIDRVQIGGTHQYTLLAKRSKYCQNCVEFSMEVENPVGMRKTLGEMSSNSLSNGQRRHRPGASRYGCSECQIYLHAPGHALGCWERHLRAVERAEKADNLPEID